MIDRSQTLPAQQKHVCISAESIALAFRFFADRTAAGFSLPEWLPTPSNLAYSAAVSQLNGVIYDLIHARRSELDIKGRAPQVTVVLIVDVTWVCSCQDCRLALGRACTSENILIGVQQIRSVLQMMNILLLEHSCALRAITRPKTLILMQGMAGSCM